MTGKDIIKRIMEEESVTNVQLAERTGVTQATMWARLNTQSAKDMQLSVFSEILGALGYEMVIRKKGDESNGAAVEIDAATKPEGRGRPRVHDRG